MKKILLVERQWLRMAKFRKVRMDFWMDPMVSEEMTPEDRYFYLYLLTNQCSTQIGIYQITTKSGSLAGDLLSLVSDFHSLFSRDRQQELQNIYSSLVDDAFIFLAWGRDIIDCEPFKLLAERCFSTLPQNKVVLGIPGEDDLKFKHPLPRGRGGSPRKWLQEAEDCFNEHYRKLS